MIPSGSPEVASAVSDARLCLLSVEGDLIRLLELDDEVAAHALPAVNVALVEARLAIQHAGRLVGVEALKAADLQRVLDAHFVHEAAGDASSVGELLGEVARLQGICAALIGEEDDEAESALLHAERARTRQLKIGLAVLALGALALGYQALALPGKAADDVRTRVRSACLQDTSCVAPVEDAIDECASTQLRWMSIWPTRYSSASGRERIRDWSAVVDCLNHAAGTPLFRLGSANTILRADMVEVDPSP